MSIRENKKRYHSRPNQKINTITSLGNLRLKDNIEIKNIRRLFSKIEKKEIEKGFFFFTKKFICFYDVYKKNQLILKEQIIELTNKDNLRKIITNLLIEKEVICPKTYQVYICKKCKTKKYYLQQKEKLVKNYTYCGHCGNMIKLTQSHKYETLIL